MSATDEKAIRRVVVSALASYIDVLPQADQPKLFLRDAVPLGLAHAPQAHEIP